MQPRLGVISIVLLFLLVEAYSKKFSLKWLAGAGHLGRGFDPDRDSILIPVNIIGGNGPPIAIRENLTFSGENTFSLRDLITRGKSASFRGQLRSSIDDFQNETNRTITSSCNADIPDWGIYHRIFNQTGKCYIPGKGESPCGDNMTFYLIEGDNTYGDCDCKVNLGLTYRRLIYWPSMEQCFALYDQGPCPPGQWLILDTTSNPICEKRTCPDLTPRSGGPWFPSNSTCFQLSTQAFCPGPNETVQYDISDMEPKCYNYTIKPTNKILQSSITLPCKLGHKDYGSAFCQKTLDKGNPA